MFGSLTEYFYTKSITPTALRNIANQFQIKIIGFLRRVSIWRELIIIGFGQMQCACTLQEGHLWWVHYSEGPRIASVLAISASVNHNRGKMISLTNEASPSCSHSPQYLNIARWKASPRTQRFEKVWNFCHIARRLMLIGVASDFSGQNLHILASNTRT